MGIEFKLNTEVGRDVQLLKIRRKLRCGIPGVGNSTGSMRGGLVKMRTGLRRLAVPDRQIRSRSWGLAKPATYVRHVSMEGKRGGAGRRYRNTCVRTIRQQPTQPVLIVKVKRTCRAQTK